MKSFKQFIEESKSPKFVGDEVDTEYNGVKLTTGSPTKVHFIRNKEKAPYLGSRFGQDIEPAGHYVTPIDKPEHKLATEQPDKYEVGTLHFNNPLVIKSDENDPTVGWKKRLSSVYGNKTKHKLSKAIAKDGYDGIITTTKYGPSETINLQMFHKKT